MVQGIKSRYAIYQILKLIKKHSLNFDQAFSKINRKNDFIESDIKFIQNVVLNSMRNYIFIDLIIKKFSSNTKIDSDSYFLLFCALSQLLILNFKEFAVVNTTVEIAKLKKINVSYKFINGVLRNILRKRDSLKVQIDFNHFPEWFKKETADWNINKKKEFINSIIKEPNIHLVFKSKNYLEETNIKGSRTSEISLTLNEKINVTYIPKYYDGIWWVQDLATMLPLHLVKNFNNKRIADLCAAPGGKTFQLLSYGANVVAFEKKIKRILLMKENLKRLSMKCKIVNCNILKTQIKEKFDIVILDAPCSSVGTIRRNPEIFFRNTNIDLKKITTIQYELLEKSKFILNKNGIIIYMVCSFLKKEGENQIFKFLRNNKDFSILKFSSGINHFSKKFINKIGFFSTIPSELENKILIDGFFAAQLIKND